MAWCCLWHWTTDDRHPEETSAELIGTSAARRHDQAQTPTDEELRATGITVLPPSGKGFIFAHPMGPIGKLRH